MRPKCSCGKIAGYWYGPSVRPIFAAFTECEWTEKYLAEKCFCADCADTENWAEYLYVGFHKKDWRWLKIKSIEQMKKEYVK